MRVFKKRFNQYHQMKYFGLALIQTAVFGALLLIDSRMWPGYLALWLLGLAGIGMVPLIIEKSRPKTKSQLSGIADTMDFTEQTLPYFREGLNSESAMIVAKIIREISSIPAVAITDRKNVLAFIGEGCEHHPVGGPIRTQATLDALEDGKIHIIEDKVDFNCKLENCQCPLTTAIIVPLFKKEEVIGCLKFYDVRQGGVSENNVKLAVGLGKLINMQVEMADSERQRQLAVEAKLDALQAQVNPHFLFNALNTINMYINKDPHYARKLVVKLSTLLRYLLGSYGRFISIAKELSHLEDYVMIENARYMDKMTVNFNVDANTEDIQIPVFTIQPLVHNAILHGVLPKKAHGQVDVNINRVMDELLITIEDDGVGIKEEELPKVFEAGYGSGCGIGISNVDERLRILYGEEYGLKIKSQLDKGTVVSFKIPIR